MPKFKMGDKVKCIDNSGMSELQIDDIYTINRVLRNQYDSKYILRECNTYQCFRECRFKLVQSATLSTPTPTCACHKNTYKDPKTPHFSWCKNDTSKKKTNRDIA